jgi:hypothetical protein
MVSRAISLKELALNHVILATWESRSSFLHKSTIMCRLNWSPYHNSIHYPQFHNFYLRPESRVTHSRTPTSPGKQGGHVTPVPLDQLYVTFPTPKISAAYVLQGSRDQLISNVLTPCLEQDWISEVLAKLLGTIQLQRKLVQRKKQNIEYSTLPTFTSSSFTKCPLPVGRTLSHFSISHLNSQWKIFGAQINILKPPFHKSHWQLLKGEL